MVNPHVTELSQLLLLVFIHRHTCTRNAQSLIVPGSRTRSCSLMDGRGPELETG